MSRRAGFSLIELLVVIGIVALLVGILLPVLSKARSASRRTACWAQLREIGTLFQLYLDENRQRIPRVNPLPSKQPPLLNAPSIFQVLDRYTKGSRAVWRCPADKITQDPGPGVPIGVETYFEREGGSYEYNVFFNAFAYEPLTGINKVWTDAIGDSKRMGRPAEKLRVFNDFEQFHGPAGKSRLVELPFCRLSRG